jgi:transposase InsO family protein
VRKIRACLKRDGFECIGSGLWALMRSMGLCIPAAERRARRPMDQAIVPASDRRWSTDMTTVWTSRDGWVAVMPVVDCGDRMLLAVEASKSQKALSRLAPVEHALESVFGERRNVPAGLELRTDHAAPSTPALTVSNCAGAGGSSTHTPPWAVRPATPWWNGSS